MFRTNPEVVVNALLALVDSKNTRVSLDVAAAALVDQGLDLGSSPKETLSALLSLVNSDVLDLRPGKGGGIGRPTMVKTPSQKRVIG